MIRKRSAIELDINDSHARLYQAYNTVSKELRRALKLRSEAIRNEVAAATRDDEEEEGEDEGEDRGEGKENEAPRRRSSGQNTNRAAGQDFMEEAEMQGNVVEGKKMS